MVCKQISINRASWEKPVNLQLESLYNYLKSTPDIVKNGFREAGICCCLEMDIIYSTFALSWESWGSRSRSCIQSKQWTNRVNITIRNFASQTRVTLSWLINDGVCETSSKTKSITERAKWINYGNASNKKRRILPFTQGIPLATPFIGQ